MDSIDQLHSKPVVGCNIHHHDTMSRTARNSCSSSMVSIAWACRRPRQHGQQHGNGALHSTAPEWGGMSLGLPGLRPARMTTTTILAQHVAQSCPPQLQPIADEGPHRRRSGVVQPSCCGGAAHGQTQHCGGVPSRYTSSGDCCTACYPRAFWRAQGSFSVRCLRGCSAAYSAGAHQSA